MLALGLGGVILAAEATEDDLGGGVAWFVVFAALAALVAFGGRFKTVREATGAHEDERDSAINTGAMAVAGQVWVLVLTGSIVFQLARGESASPYIQLMVVGAAAYGIALLFLRWRS
jgi:hypothetical protein